MLLPHWGWGWGAGAVSWRLHSHQDLRVQPELGPDRWALAPPSPPGLLDLWEPSQPHLQPPGPLASGHFPFSLEPCPPQGPSVEAHSPAPPCPDPLFSSPRQGQ